MLLAKGNKITFKYESQTQELLTGINFRVDSRSRIGIVGKNGCGKSTFLKILLGELRPFSGHLQISSELRVGYLRQVQPKDDGLLVIDYVWSAIPKLQALKKRLSSLESNPKEQDWSVFTEYEEAGGYDFEILIEKNLAHVGLNTSFLQRTIQSLSGGERTKVGLLRILVTNPSLLLLDEPTNNLDMDSIRWLKGYLSSTPLPFIVVSHDRTLLNESIREIWEIENGELNIYSGDYDFLKKTKDQKYTSDLDQFERQQKKIGQLQSAASERRVDANRMENFKKPRSIKKNGGLCKRDEGAGSGSANPTKKMKSAKAVEKRAHLMVEREEAKKPWIEKKRKISLPVTSTSPSKKVLSVKDLGLHYEDKTIFSGIELSVEKSQRLAVVGPNGSGKTSLIKILNGQLNQSCGEVQWASSAVVSVFYQDNVDLSGEKTVLQSVWQPEIVEEHIIRTVLGSLGVGTNLINQKINKLSPGEKVKISLARAVLSGANTLILDEPTNHLEVQSREMLEQALIDYEGTAIFVSHDVAFIKNVGTHVFDLSLNQVFHSYLDWEVTMNE